MGINWILDEPDSGPKLRPKLTCTDGRLFLEVEDEKGGEWTILEITPDGKLYRHSYCAVSGIQRGKNGRIQLDDGGE